MYNSNNLVLHSLLKNKIEYWLFKFHIDSPGINILFNLFVCFHVLEHAIFMYNKVIYK